MECLKYILALWSACVHGQCNLVETSGKSEVALVMSMCLSADSSLPQPRAPNFQYFERPNYRYPYYDENGKGKLLYGYGGPELYQYKSYSPLEGIY